MSTRTYKNQLRLTLALSTIPYITVACGTSTVGNSVGTETIHDAAKSGDLGKVKQLVRDGVDPDITDKDGNTPLDYALLNGRTIIVDFLKTKAQGLPRRPALDIYAACREGNLSELKAHVFHRTDLRKPVTSGILGRAKDEGFTPLLVAVQHGQTEIVRVLLANGVSPNCQAVSGKFRDTTPLCTACKGGPAEIVELLLQHKADPNALGCDPYYAMNYDNRFKESGESREFPIVLAIRKNRKDVVELLVGAGADVNKLCAVRIGGFTFSSTPLDDALEMKDKGECCQEIIELLRQHGALTKQQLLERPTKQER